METNPSTREGGIKTERFNGKNLELGTRIKNEDEDKRAAVELEKSVSHNWREVTNHKLY